MKAQEYLRKVKKIDMIISNKMDEVLHWESVSTSITSKLGAERVQSSGNKGSMENAVCEKLDIMQDLRKGIKSLLETRREIIDVIEGLSAEEYDLVYKVYVGRLVKMDNGSYKCEYMTLQEVADLYCNSYGWASGIHGNALKKVQKILDEKEKSGI